MSELYLTHYYSDDFLRSVLYIFQPTALILRPLIVFQLRASTHEHVDTVDDKIKYNRKA